jgi:hypothetical protein
VGFGFNFFFIFVLVPATALLLVIWAISRKRIFGIALGCIWMFIFALAFLSGILRGRSKNKNLDINDYHGNYIINRNYFAGKQADWQYNHFRFEIKDNDSIYFYVTDGSKILKTYKGKVSTTNNYISARLILHMDSNTHHIMLQNPTTIRSAWSFTLAFYSPVFNNVYFKKGDWEPIRQ